MTIASKIDKDYEDYCEDCDCASEANDYLFELIDDLAISSEDDRKYTFADNSTLEFITHNIYKITK